MVSFSVLLLSWVLPITVLFSYTIFCVAFLVLCSCFVILFDSSDCSKFWKFMTICWATIFTCLRHHFFSSEHFFGSFIFLLSLLIFWWHLCINLKKNSCSVLNMMSFFLNQLFSENFSGGGSRTVSGWQGLSLVPHFSGLYMWMSSFRIQSFTWSTELGRNRLLLMQIIFPSLFFNNERLPANTLRACVCVVCARVYV